MTIARISVAAAALLVPSLALAAERATFESLFPDMDPVQVRTRAALIDASWDVPLEVMERIPGAALTDEERLREEGLASLVNPANANLTLPFVDLRLGSAGPEATVERTYNSLETLVAEFGRGWSWSYGVRLQQLGETVVVTESDGSTITFEKSDAGFFSSLGQELVKDGRGWLRTSKEAGEAERYDKRGFLLERTDSAGRKLTLKRDGEGRLLAIVAANGREIRVKSDARGRIVSMTDPAGRVATYEYAEDRLVASVVDGLVTSYAYDADHTISQVTYPTGANLQLRYNEGGWISEIQLGSDIVRASFTFSADTPALHGALIKEGAGDSSESTRYSYDEDAGTAEVTFPDGSKVAKKFDTTCGCMTEAKQGDDAGRFAYDESGRMSEMAGDDSTIRFTYGPRAVRTMEIKANDPAKSAAMTFDDGGNLLRVDSNGRSIAFEYQSGLVTKVAEKGRVGQWITYTATGDVATVKNSEGDSVSFEYDASGMVTAIHRGNHTTLEFKRVTGSFVPKVRLTQRSKAGITAVELPPSEMQFLYGDAASAVPVKKASLDRIGGTKVAGLPGMPLGGLSVFCYGRDCARMRVGACLVPVLLNTLSPIGTPLSFNTVTGTWEIDLKEWATGRTEDELKDAIKEAAKAEVEKAKKKGWFKRAVSKVAGFAEGLVKKAAKVVLKVVKTLIKPIQVVLALKDAYDCFRNANSDAKRYGCQKADASFLLRPDGAPPLLWRRPTTA